MAGIKLPFKLEKPSDSEFVTNADAIDFDGTLDVKEKIDKIDSILGDADNLTDNDIISAINNSPVKEDKADKFYFVDSEGNVICIVSKDGILSPHYNIMEGESNKGIVTHSFDDDFHFADNNGSVVCVIGENGVMSQFFRVKNGDDNEGIITHSGDGAIYFADENGNYSVYIDKNGALDAKKIGKNLTKIISGIGGSSSGSSTENVTDILSLNPSSEFLPKLQQMAHNPRSGQKTVGTTFSFLFFSDIHYSTNNLERILDFYEKYEAYINGGIISGGDNINYYWGAQSNSYSEWLSVNGADKILSVVGNHDAWQSTWNDMAAQKDVYDRMFAPCVSKWGVTQPADAATNGLMYWYKDYLNTANSSNGILGIRVIGLDCMHWNSTQKAWLTELLQDAIDNSLAVVGVTHYVAGSLDRWDCAFDDKLDTINTSTLLSNDAATCVDNFQKNGGEFICWLAGHTHNDFVGTLKNFPAQVNVVVSTASINSLQCAYCDASRVEGTRSQDLFDIVSFDTYNKLIKVCRVGCCYDHSMQYANTMNIQYKTSPTKTLDKVSGSTLDSPQLINY